MSVDVTVNDILSAGSDCPGNVKTQKNNERQDAEVLGVTDTGCAKTRIGRPPLGR